ncbi:MAG: CocE/NonD family hydrolase [Synergistaceae bacterium]|nr:CocE/NonD family hydrolase [Synergistaceae bacterium]MBQ3399470.1 CocE/NonD family hydrolase [Synergistaceae bacterium]MBQ3759578.1 CocE/NonD family hydrolase [Synergistaceae bacterium]MBQ4402295.1 CocE/NonD family hydrolase [Synergistaceae bacterium]MBQ6417265.1 CocE/NonD family hydrolase [Synergistaceae bacterium]
MSELEELMIFKPSKQYKAECPQKIASGRSVLPKGWQSEEGFMPLPCEIVVEKDVRVKMRDGVEICVDVFRPKTDEKVPVLISWSPYGKDNGTRPSYKSLFAMIGIPDSKLSGLQKFEGSDPAYWCSHGYAVCNPDSRGITKSGGTIYTIGSHEAQDGYDLIEWLAAQDWCNGKVALSGTSYLAFSQWFIASAQPPHLAAINPEEGLSDAYRDLISRGGITDVGFAARIQFSQAHEGDPVQWEDLAAEGLKYPLYDNALWRDKTAHPERITCPAYVVASYSNTLHTMGTFRAWRAIPEGKKWIRIHDGQEWPDFYTAEHIEDRRKFFDHFLKGINNGWEDTPTVRYSLHDFEGGNITGITAESFPPAGVTYEKLYLDGMTRTLNDKQGGSDFPVKYDAEGVITLASFLYTANERTEIVGYPKVKLWVEAEGHDDMDVYISLYKLDRNGNMLQQFVIPNHCARNHDLTERGGSILRYRGSTGRLRVSMRHLDDEKTTPEIPYHSFDRVEKLKEGEIVPVEIEMYPTGLIIYTGEQLRLVVSATDEAGSMMPGTSPAKPNNKGKHVIHCGGNYDSYLQLPFKR